MANSKTVKKTIQLPDCMVRHKLAIIIAVGIAVKLILMPITAHPFDVFVWYKTSQNILDNGLLNLTDVQVFPPLWMPYSLAPLGVFYNWLAQFVPTGLMPMSSLPPEINFYPQFGITVVPGLLFNSIIKLPFFISDIVITYCIYKIVLKLTNKNRLAEVSGAMWFLNPFVIWVSSGWGMFDSLAVMFYIASLYFILNRHLSLSALTLALAVLTKLYPVIFLFPMLVFLWRDFPSKRRNLVLKYCFIFTAVLLVFLLPIADKIVMFFSAWLATSSVDAAYSVANPLASPIGFGLTYWSSFLALRYFDFALSSVFVEVVSVVATSVTIVLVVINYKHTYKLNSPENLINTHILLLLGFFLTFRIICEQFFVWVLPLLIVAYATGHLKSWYYWIPSSIALAYSLLNCPLPLFLVPLYPWLGNSLLNSLQAIMAFDSLRVVSMIVLGCLFSVITLSMYCKLYKKKY